MTASYVLYLYSRIVEKCEDGERISFLMGFEPATSGSGVLPSTPEPLHFLKLHPYHQRPFLCSKDQQVNYKTNKQEGDMTYLYWRYLVIVWSKRHRLFE